MSLFSLTDSRLDTEFQQADKSIPAEQQTPHWAELKSPLDMQVLSPLKVQPFHKIHLH